MNKKSEFSQKLEEESPVKSPKALDDKILAYSRQQTQRTFPKPIRTPRMMPWATAVATVSLVGVAIFITQQAPTNKLPSAMAPTYTETSLLETENREARESLKRITSLEFADSKRLKKSNAKKQILMDKQQPSNSKDIASAEGVGAPPQGSAHKSSLSIFSSSLTRQESDIVSAHSQNKLSPTLLPRWGESLFPEITLISLPPKILGELKTIIHLLDSDQINEAKKHYQEIRLNCNKCHFPEEMPHDFGTKIKEAFTGM